MRVTDYIATFVRDRLNVETVFMVSGGGMMFLSDGLACNKRVKVVCNHHEQAAAMAAVGYAKQRNSFGAAMVTTGCGGTNAITGVLNAWQDSARVFFISGQCKLCQTTRGKKAPIRQFGVQEADIVSIVGSITKYATMIEKPEDIAYELEKAMFLASDGRPGPVWIDVPMDVSGALIDAKSLRHFKIPSRKMRVARKEIQRVASCLTKANRPVILAGQGIALSETQKPLLALARKIKAPIVTSFLGGNSISGLDAHYIGRIGTKGSRAGNIAVANSDVLLVVGSRLSVSTTGHEYEMFARHAKIIVVDVDEAEHSKNTVRIDKFIKADLKTFLPELVRSTPVVESTDWLVRCQNIKSRYPIVSGCPVGNGSGVSLYDFIGDINKEICSKPNWSVVSDAGSSFYVTTQAIEISPVQRYVTSGGQAEMGYSLPAAIGVAAGGARKVIAISGDGSVQMNIQELQTLKHYRLPIKLFIWNNDGYLSIRATQNKFFKGRLIGTDSTSGVSFPSFKKLASAYGIRYVKIKDVATLGSGVKEALLGDDPVVCEVMCMRDEVIVPSIASIKLPSGKMKSMPPEDMYPFLPWDEFKNLMCVDPIPRT